MMSEWISCDSCSARALWQVNGMSNYLTFCGHHKNEYSQAIDSWATNMIELEQVNDIPILERMVR